MTERHPERIGMQGKSDVFANEVPQEICEDVDADYAERCFAALPKVDVNKVLEWGTCFYTTRLDI